MKTQLTPAERAFVVVGVLIGWFAVGLQFYLVIVDRVETLAETVVRFFSYFTILTNIIVALYFTAMASGKEIGLKPFFIKPGVSTAITIYITVVGLVYQLILRPLWSPAGWSKVADELLHSVMPLYVILYWFVFVPKSAIDWKQIPSWLIYPLGYFGYILLRGIPSGFYPYPFIDVPKLGYPAVLLNSVGLTVLFGLLSAGFVALAKGLSRSVRTM